MEDVSSLQEVKLSKDENSGAALERDLDALYGGPVDEEEDDSEADGEDGLEDEEEDDEDDYEDDEEED